MHTSAKTNRIALVTGGSGLVGSHLVFKLLKEKRLVRVLIRDSDSQQKILRTFYYYSDDANVLLSKIEWVYGDITDIDSLTQAFAYITDVYHCAAFVSFTRRNYKKMCQVNIEGTRNIVNLCLEKNIRKLVHVSSIATIGNSNEDLCTDAKSVSVYDETGGFSTGRQSPYAYTKTQAELEVWRGMSEGLNAVIVNPAVILGPGNWNNGSGQFFSLVDSGLKFYTNGSTSFVGVVDVVNIMIKLMEHSIHTNRYILTAEPMTYNAFFKAIAQALGEPGPKILAKKWITAIAWRIEGVISIFFRREPGITKWSVLAGHTHQSYLSTKIKKLLNFNFTSLSDVIIATTNFYKLDK